MKAAFAEPEIITRKGKPFSVIIPVKEDDEMLERMEEAEDVACLKTVRPRPLHYRPFADVLADHAKK